MVVLLSNQSQILIMFKFFVRMLFILQIIFIDFIRNLRASRPKPLLAAALIALMSQRTSRSLLPMDFRGIVLSHWLLFGMHIASTFASNVLCKVSEAGDIEQSHKHESLKPGQRVANSLHFPG
jgi:hypothetical protein